MKRYENLEKAMCRELDKLDKKYATDVPEMSVQDVERADILFHAMKSAETYYAMTDSDLDEEEMNSRSGRGGRSYRRGRDSMGRYTSRDMEYSGHYPEWMPPYYPQRY